MCIRDRNNTYQIYLISDSTGETLDRIFTAIKAQFKNIEYKIHTFSFTRTENQITKILSNAKKQPNSIILYSIVDSSLAKYLANISHRILKERKTFRMIKCNHFPPPISISV